MAIGEEYTPPVEQKNSNFLPLSGASVYIILFRQLLLQKINQNSQIVLWEQETFNPCKKVLNRFWNKKCKHKWLD